ncbi:hypothetical protein Pmani_003835 [Petrolisthes manimaculis]|uniref:GDP-fucose protein O-fucosyltransferase 2 n=1 Tax=Petrolisthes manimaculis TaxID=1843537 RepID=A0AAE1UI23_9EUCA|nr:hypothetical protein Pmani_003835 [Petrolisthes manimaculis]
MSSSLVKILLWLVVFTLFVYVRSKEESCEQGSDRSARYLLYDVNPGEGFNLRRDVYLRIANLVRKLNQFDNWVLVLPPWGNLYHWRNVPRGTYFPWKAYFDMPSLNKWIQVMEFEDYVKVHGPRIRSAYILQHYDEEWSGNWQEKYDERPCLNEHSFIFREEDEMWQGMKWGTVLEMQKLKCLSVQGYASSLLPLLTKEDDSRSIYLRRSETVLHDDFGGQWYWSARRSMRFAASLLKEAQRFRHEVLNSDDTHDKTQVKDDWRDTKPERGTALGGPYISVHLRRRDFVHARNNEIPSLKKAAKQINQILRRENLTTVFVATDAPAQEVEELRTLVEGVLVVYEPSTEVLQRGGDGAVAIIDQIICSHARYFTGTYESTFSFRIQEEREIMGFQVETTFNRLCGKNTKCEQPAKWKISY